jgi:hypothetical protein
MALAHMLLVGWRRLVLGVLEIDLEMRKAEHGLETNPQLLASSFHLEVLLELLHPEVVEW